MRWCSSRWASKSSSTPVSATTRCARTPNGTSCNCRSFRICRGSATAASRSTTSSAPICISIMSVGTLCWRDKWVATFPNARYLIGGTEWDFFSRQEDDFFKPPVDDSVRPLFAEGRADLVDDKRKITDEVWLESTPGHTPGHFAVRISSEGEDAVITGDLMHHPIQCRYPEWDDNFDVDGPQAKKTRREFCERYADGKTLVLGTHFATPSAGKIVKKDDSFRFVLA